MIKMPFHEQINTLFFWYLFLYTYQTCQDIIHFKLLIIIVVTSWATRTLQKTNNTYFKNYTK